MGELLFQVLIDTSKGIKNYIKAQLIMAIISFLFLMIGLKYIGIEYSGLKALGIAIVDAVPIIGSGIIMIPWAIYKFFTDTNDIGFKIAILYVALTVFKQLIQPKIVGDNIGISPLYTFLLTIIGFTLIGSIGVILGPLAAIVLKSFINGKKMIEYRDRKDKIDGRAKFYDLK